MRIDDVIWDEINTEHIWQRHRVATEEVEEVCLGRHVALKGRDGCYLIFGRTSTGRYLMIPVHYIRPRVVRPITAMNMTDVQRRWFKQKGK